MRKETEVCLWFPILVLHQCPLRLLVMAFKSMWMYRGRKELAIMIEDVV